MKKLKPDEAAKMIGAQAGKRRGKYLVAPDGRTKKAYNHQPAPQKYVCSLCVHEQRAEHLKEEKGRDSASAKERDSFSYRRKQDLRNHTMLSHNSPRGEQKNYNRIKRDKAQAAARP